jgi:GT2 family glycosyltransferase
LTSTAPISAIVTAYQRIEQTVETLRRLQACRPAPDEILIHVDANQSTCADAISHAFPHLRVFLSPTPIGPGGGRNRLVAEAQNELIASFDDDSYPVDSDYFQRACVVMEIFPEAALVGSSITQRGETPSKDRMVVARTSSFGAGGVVLRRSEFLRIGGFVPLVVAYGMEEEDLAIRLLDRGRTLLTSPWLRVFHDSDLTHHSHPEITAGVIANLALLAYLRYPVAFWPYGALQVANRCWWCVQLGRRAGVVTGLGRIPGHLWRHRHMRHLVSWRAMKQRLAARKAEAMTFRTL